jgi:uncharacterized protein YutE (UPF0331/DUF86 family)
MAAPINREMVLARISDMEAQLAALRGQAALPDGAFLGDPKEIKSARYSLIVLVEAAAAICGHVVARLLRQAVDAYPECFAALAAHGLLDPDLARRLSAMARFRNILVHGYGRVDDRHLLAMLRTDLVDVDRYVEAIRTLVAGSAGRETEPS